MLSNGREINVHEIESAILEISSLVKEVAVIMHENRLFAVICPDFDEATRLDIVNIENEIR